MKGVSKNETVWEDVKTKSGERYIITSKQDRASYILYKVEDEVATKVGTGKTPQVLWKKYLNDKYCS